MIDLECKRRRSNQFNNILLNAQDKVNYNKITEIREDRNANSIYTGSATSRANVQSSSNPLEMVIIIKKGENVNHAGFDDVKKNLLDNDCHHQKGGECKSCRF